MKYIILFLALIASQCCFSQNRVVHGNVYAFSGLPLKNIKISAKNSNATAISDAYGNFTIVCEAKEQLTFSGNGFKTIRKKLKKKDSIRLKMNFKQGKSNENVAVGYGHVTKENLLEASSQYIDNKNNYAQYPDIFTLLKQKFSGVRIIGVGSQFPKVVVNGGPSSFSLDNTALYVVDNVIVQDISNIPTPIIKNISILKVASIYGARGANGALIITTKK